MFHVCLKYHWNILCSIWNIVAPISLTPTTRARNRTPKFLLDLWALLAVKILESQKSIYSQRQLEASSVILENTQKFYRKIQRDRNLELNVMHEKLAFTLISKYWFVFVNFFRALWMLVYKWKYCFENIDLD